MSVFEINGGRINHRYLMNKTKYDLAHTVMDYLREWEKSEKENTDLRTRLAAAEQENARLNSLLYGGRCVYCGEVVGVDTLNQDLSDEVLKEHIKTCAAHPYVQMKERAEVAEKELDLLRREQAAWRKFTDEANATVDKAEKERDELRAENERLAGEVERLKGLLATGAGCERGYRQHYVELLEKEVALRKQAESALKAAQQSAKGQFGAGMERAAEIASEFHANENWRKYGGPEEQVAATIREAAKEGDK